MEKKNKIKWSLLFATLIVYIPNNNNVANLFTKILLHDTKRNFTSDLELWESNRLKEKRWRKMNSLQKVRTEK